MQVQAKLGTIRITPRKLGVVADEIRGKGINDALNFLKFCPRQKTAKVFEVLLKSAVANADQKGTMDIDRLVVKKLLVGQGPTLKRFMTRAKGSASGLLKRTANITVVLEER